MNRRILICLALLGYSLIPHSVWSMSAEDQAREKEALQMINTSQQETGLGILKDLASKNQDDGAIQMNYGSVLFSKATFTYQSADKKKGIALLLETQPYFALAASLFDAHPDQDPTGKLRSQIHYLLGDVYFYGAMDKTKAVEHYETSLKHWPQHEGAQRAFENALKNEPGMVADISYAPEFTRKQVRDLQATVQLADQYLDDASQILKDPRVKIQFVVTDNLESFEKGFVETIKHALPQAEQFLEDNKFLRQNGFKHNAMSVLNVNEKKEVICFTVIESEVFKDPAFLIDVVIHEMAHIRTQYINGSGAASDRRNMEMDALTYSIRALNAIIKDAKLPAKITEGLKTIYLPKDEETLAAWLGIGKKS